VKLDSSSGVLDPPVNERDHMKGPELAPVTLVEYGDYECPYCGNAHPVVQKLLAEMGPRLRFVFRNFPLNNVHPRASVAAQAAESAGAQGKFWEMHDLLYENQDSLDPADIERFALRIGLEVYQFEADLSAERFAKRVAADFDSGVRSGVKRTPTFFINGAIYEGETSYEAMKRAIEGAAGR
jgi:protein-disulfide isomerase